MLATTFILLLMFISVLLLNKKEKKLEVYTKEELDRIKLTKF
jgi:hypothetical protein